MTNVLVFCEYADGQIKKGSLCAITCGKEIAEKSGGHVDAVVVGKDVTAAAEHAASFGINKVYTVAGEAFEHYLAESYATAVAQVAAQASSGYVIGATNATTKDLLPRVSGRLKAAMASDVLAVVEADTFKRPMWAGNVVATVRVKSAKKVCSVRATEFEPAQASSSASIENVQVDVDLNNLRTKFVSLKEIKSERPDATTANVVVSGGRGVKGPEGFKVIEELADLLNGGVGASRAVCDAGWVPNDLQIGQTGKVVAPNLYFAIGISGAIQHLAGMKGSKVIVAINKDPDAPIFQVADYGLVADLFEAVPELIEKIKATR